MHLWKTVAALIVLGTILGTVSCASKGRIVYADINSLSQADVSGKTRYLLLPGEKDVEASDLQFIEYATLIDKVMAERGYIKVQVPDQADIAVFLSYGIGSPQTQQESYSIPIYGQTGVSSAQTFGTISSFGGVGTYSGTTTYTPKSGIAGYQSGVHTYTTYTRFLILAAYDVVASIKDKKLVQAWKTEVTSTGNSDDLRLIFPVMAASMKPYLATNTGQKVQVKLFEKDPKVLELRGVNIPTTQPAKP